MPVINEDLGCLFLMAPRTGSTAIATEVLIPQLGGRWLPQCSIEKNGRIVVDRKHATVDQLVDHGLLTDRQRQSLLIFTTVRNPFDSLVSLYVKQRHQYPALLEDPDSWVHKKPAHVRLIRAAQELSFAEYVAYRFGPEGWRQRLRHLFRRWPPHRRMYGSFEEACDVVMRFEDLQSDFNGVLDRLGVGPLEIPVSNRTTERAGRSYRDYYDRRARSLVATAYKSDLVRHGYSF